MGATTGCSAPPMENGESIFLEKEGELVVCEQQATPSVVQGYDIEVDLITLNGHSFNSITGNALYAMQQQALQDGIELRVLQGFIPHEELETLYACGPDGNCDCNWCNEIPFPGYSPHQAGRAVDIDLEEPGALEWLEEYGETFGFNQATLGLKWHWVHDGLPVTQGPCAPELDAEATLMVDTTPQIGFWTLRSTGAITPYGDVQYHGAPSPLEFPGTWVGLAPNSSMDGYWVLSSTGKVEGFGAASAAGDAAITFSSGNAVGIVADWTSGGYWLATEDGNIQEFGGATALEEVQVSSSTSPVVAMVSTNENNGFWILREDGSLRLFNAPFYGEISLISGAANATGLSPTESGEGYWILTEDGSLYPFGDATEIGSVQGLTDSPATDILRVFTGGPPGCWVLEQNGNITALGNAGAPVQSALGYNAGPVAPPEFSLQASYSPDRSDPFLLEGATVQGDIYIFVAPVGDASRVRFAVDSDPVSGTPLGEDKTWPFDLAGGNPQAANPFDTFSLANGERLMNAIVERLHGLEASWATALFTVNNPVCGDGKLEGGEECDSGPCCDPEKCQLLEMGILCREKAGKCDVEEFCDGSSPFCASDEWLPQGTVCRPAGTSCDVEELCNGTVPTCPPNAVVPEGTPCEDEGFCELGFCNTPERPEEDTTSQGDTEEEGDTIDPDSMDSMDVEGVDGSEMDTWNPDGDDAKESWEDSWEEDTASEEDSETTPSEDTAIEMDGTTTPPQGDDIMMDGGALDSQASLKNDTRAGGSGAANDAALEPSPGDSVTDGEGANLASNEGGGCTQTTPGRGPLFLLLLPLLLLVRRSCPV